MRAKTVTALPAAPPPDDPSSPGPSWRFGDSLGRSRSPLPDTAWRRPARARHGHALANLGQRRAVIATGGASWTGPGARDRSQPVPAPALGGKSAGPSWEGVKPIRDAIEWRRLVGVTLDQGEAGPSV